MIAIINYGLGNLGSIKNMLKRLGIESVITGEKEVILSAEKLILPGVGAFDVAMENLATRGLIDLLNEKVLINKTPILGICLGMQIMSKSSEEGKLPGLGWFDAQTIRFKFENGNSNLKIPHMGWNEIEIKKSDSILTAFDKQPRFYFVHSYHVQCNRPEDTLTSTPYGFQFSSAISRDNIWGVQFHPEKSHKFGMRLLKNFASL